MIDIQTEEVVSLTVAAKSKCLPRRRKGKRPHVATLFRWATVGVRGVVLETIQCGGTRCTSVEAIQRFFERCSGADDPAVIPSEVATRRAKAIAEANARLEAAGIQ